MLPWEGTLLLQDRSSSPSVVCKLMPLHTHFRLSTAQAEILLQLFSMWILPQRLLLLDHCHHHLTQSCCLLRIFRARRCFLAPLLCLIPSVTIVVILSYRWGNWGPGCWSGSLEVSQLSGVRGCLLSPALYPLGVTPPGKVTLCTMWRLIWRPVLRDRVRPKAPKVGFWAQGALLS